MKGERRHVYKDPVTDHAKRSKPGRLKLVRAPDGSLATVAEDAAGQDLLRQVFRDGQLSTPLRFEDVRRNAAL